MAERMANEREAFGFYFSAHPVDRYRHLADAHGARPFAALCAQPAPVDGARTGALMACLIEDVRWRTSARGRRYAMAKLSDATSQFDASCFDDEVSKTLEEVASGGGCALLTVELDRQPGEETPRVTLKRVQRFEGLAANTRLRAEVAVADVAGVLALAALVTGERGGRGEVLLHVDLADFDSGAADRAPRDRHQTVRLGRDFALDAELAARIGALPGVLSMHLGPADPHLRLVG
jgi:DNA polymerase-3 subunit alpha